MNIPMSSSAADISSSSGSQFPIFLIRQDDRIPFFYLPNPQIQPQNLQYHKTTVKPQRSGKDRSRNLFNMSAIVPSMVSGMLHSHRTIFSGGIAIICIAATTEAPNDPIEIKSFRYQTLHKIIEIYNVNLALSDMFDNINLDLGDDYYLDMVDNAFVELDNAFIATYDQVKDVNPANISIASRRIIEALAFVARISPDEVIHLGSFQTITARPLPRRLSEQILICKIYLDKIHQARNLFTETIRRPETLTEDWQCSGFRNRSHFLRQVLVPIAVTQLLGGAHFLRWLALGLNKSLNSDGRKATPFKAGDLAYDPENQLLLPSHTAARLDLGARLTPWTSPFRGVWTYPEVSAFIRSSVYKQEAAVVEEILATRQLQFKAGAPRKLGLPIQSSQDSSNKMSSPTEHELRNSRVDSLGIPYENATQAQEAESKQSILVACGNPATSKVKIAKTPRSCRQLRQKRYWSCPHCSIKISLQKDMERHVSTKHGQDGNVYYCPVQDCKRSRDQDHPFHRIDNWRRHAKTVHKLNLDKVDTIAI